jgi:uncharacterized protein YeaO (DUF488 family)
MWLIRLGCLYRASPEVALLARVWGIADFSMAGELPMFRLKRAYEAVDPSDGTRVLVDRLWPRGLSKAEAHVDLWLKEVAPSAELRKWYGHDPQQFDEFRRRYLVELQDEAVRQALKQLRDLARRGTVTLLVGARDSEHSDGAVLLELLQTLEK